MRKKLFYLLFAFAVFVSFLLQACSRNDRQAPAEQLPEQVSYNFDIRPILSDNCFACHGPDAKARQAGLRLDLPGEAYKALAEHPGAHALVPGKPALSEAFRRITASDTALLMPPPASNLKLTSHQVRLIEKWIRQGAVYEPHWAFTAPRKPGVPQVRNPSWPRNQIDYFVLQKLEQKGISPNPQAGKERLLRRLSFDLTGLPPDLEMMDRFLADSSARAYEKIVDALLQSPAYGEKMALHWLDVARYADSYGYQLDNLRTQWPWRDWVIHAFNKNLPYDQFITWQLAGDLLPRATKEQLLATGFNRNHKITEEGAVDEEEYRITYVTDRTNTFGKALLGVTMECANCHDHKFDPITQKEYFGLFAFFNQVDERRSSTSPIDPTVGKPESYAKKPLMQISEADVKGILAFVNKTDTSRLIVSVMGELATPRKTHVLHRGVFNAPREEVQPGTPKAILPFEGYAPNRLGLTQWLFDKKHPLTARVFVNRIWQEFFGRGLVKTGGDWGMQGELPSHPALLDWLAVDFINHGWDIKRLVRQLVTSATYRQSAVAGAEKRHLDPENILLARAPRYHLPAELIRDMVLASSGLLVKTIGGPSVKPYQPPGLWEGATAGGSTLASYQQDHGAALYRRGIYTFIKRTVPPPAMRIFDASNRDQCEVARSSTNTPLQALVMLNDPTVLEASRVLAASLLREKSSAREKIHTGFRRILGRRPDPKELQVLQAYYQKRLRSLTPAKARELLDVGEYPQATDADPVAQAALMQVLHTLYNLEEAISKS